MRLSQIKAENQLRALHKIARNVRMMRDHGWYVLSMSDKRGYNHEYQGKNAQQVLSSAFIDFVRHASWTC